MHEILHFMSSNSILDWNLFTLTCFVWRCFLSFYCLWAVEVVLSRQIIVWGIMNYLDVGHKWRHAKSAIVFLRQKGFWICKFLLNYCCQCSFWVIKHYLTKTRLNGKQNDLLEWNMHSSLSTLPGTKMFKLFVYKIYQIRQHKIRENM